MAKKKPEEEKKPQKRGGSDTIREKGQKAVLVAFEPEDHAALKAAAGIRGIPMNELVKEATNALTKKILADFQKK